MLELASESLASIPRIRIVCNTEVSAEDEKTVRMATGARRKELEEGLLRLAWNAGHFPHLVDVHGMPAQQRLHVLHDLLMASGKDGRLFEIRLVPDSEFGFVHGKGGIIEGAGVNGDPTNRTSFIGSANDSARAWTKNYELVWEDDTPESVTWVQEEFDALWNTGVSAFRIHCQTDRPLVAAHGHRACRPVEGKAHAGAVAGAVAGRAAAKAGDALCPLGRRRLGHRARRVPPGVAR